MEKTLFQRIIDREIPATIEYEDDHIIAIRDIAPSAPVHLLIIPKPVIASIDALRDTDAELVGRVFIVARDLARKFGIAEDGYRVVTNCNEHGGQTVFHLHFHVLGGEHLGRMNSSAASHAHVTDAAAAPVGLPNMVRDIALFMLVSIGLAVGFNAMNPKAIAWIKPQFERQTASQTDIDKYLQSTPPAPQREIIQQAPAASDVADTATATTSAAASPQAPAPPTTAVAKPLPTSTTAADAAFSPEPGVIREITYDMFVRLLQGTKSYLIDARGAEKFAQGHIDGAVNFYGGEVQSRIPDILSNVPRDRVVLIYCDGGECELSHHVADVLKQFGYGPIFIYTGGWAEWTSKRK
jgi:histidine triad (HIT) family protein